MKTNGYRPVHRNRWLLLQSRILNKDELLLLEYYIDQMDFDRRHECYGTFQVDIEYLTRLFGYKVNKSNNSIRKRHNKLIKLGFIFPTRQKNVFGIFNPERYIAQTNKWQGKANEFREKEMNQSLENIIQYIATNVQQFETSFQPTEKSDDNLLKFNPPRTLGSSKVESNGIKQKIESLAEEVTRPVKTLLEYKKIYDQGGYTTLTPDDMQWLDENY